MKDLIFVMHGYALYVNSAYLIVAIGLGLNLFYAHKRIRYIRKIFLKR